jgi:predicted DNA-binding transcriptional regulator YafY
MSQRERDRLVVLRKAETKLITQRQAAQDLEVSERQIHRMLRRLKQVGDRR